MSFVIVIPARLESSRLPQKVLLDVAGKPLLQRTYEQAKRFGALRTIIASDNEQILSLGRHLGAETCQTGMHENGTARIGEVCRLLALPSETIIVNMQADEPLLPLEAVRAAVGALLSAPNAALATLAVPILEPEQIFNPNCVKLVLDKQQRALYFSRAPIPWDRGKFPALASEPLAPLFYRHLGLYAYRAASLETYHNLSVSPLEQLEALEQLRFLWHGFSIQVAILESNLPPGIDTESDLTSARHYYHMNAL